MLKKQNIYFFFLYSEQKYKSKRIQQSRGIETSEFTGYYVYNIAEFMKPDTRSLVIKFIIKIYDYVCGDDYVR